MSTTHTPVRRFILAFTLAATALGLVFAAQAATPGASADVAAQLGRAGYAEIREIEHDDGLWEAEVRRADGRWGEVHVDPVSGEIFDRASSRPLLDAAAVVAALQSQGYTAVEDLDREGATWDAEAHAPDGLSYELRVSGFDGRVLHREIERDD